MMMMCACIWWHCVLLLISICDLGSWIHIQICLYTVRDISEFLSNCVEGYIFCQVKVIKFWEYSGSSIRDGSCIRISGYGIIFSLSSTLRDRAFSKISGVGVACRFDLCEWLVVNFAINVAADDAGRFTGCRGYWSASWRTARSGNVGRRHCLSQTVCLQIWCNLC